MIEAKEIPHKMLSKDAFSQWLGISILNVEKGRCKVALTIRPEMLNSMQKAHGGISYSLADTAFGFAANTHGNYAVSIETSINHINILVLKQNSSNQYELITNIQALQTGILSFSDLRMANKAP